MRERSDEREREERARERSDERGVRERGCVLNDIIVSHGLMRLPPPLMHYTHALHSYTIHPLHTCTALMH
jgi:hypothetical protein